MSNARWPNPKPLRNGTSELQGIPQTVLNNPLRRDKTGASQQSCLQHALVTQQSLEPQAQAVMHSMLRRSNKAK